MDSTFREKLEKLIAKFDADREHHLSRDYAEAQARIDFITPLFEMLGWDVRNDAGLPHHAREVLVETSEAETLGKPDYSFRLNGQTKFFVEAKAPAEPLDAARHILQAKGYAWNTRQVFFVILTDFEEFRFYDASIQPDERKPDEGLLLKLRYTDYLKQAEKLWEFSKDRVAAGSLDAMLPRDRRTQRLRIPVDEAFLDEMTDWREDLARNVFRNNPELTAKQLNEVVQRLLDRIVFIRIAEDRRIIEKRQLADAVEEWRARGGKFPIFDWLNDLFHRINEDFNGEIFKPHLSETIRIDSEVLARIIERLYPPKSPYRFDVIGVELLGSIYERYLGKTIRVTPKRVHVEEKPEVRKAGGVYYTPKYIVDYIVKHTVGKVIEGKTPKQIEKIRILDPACGSGSFLIGAFQYLIDYHVRYLTEHPKEAHIHPLFPDLIKGENPSADEPRLSVVRKARILRNNLFGIDIDPQAVEITMMSLYLKALEGERSQLPPKHALLPELKYNIVCGNSLIGPDIYEQGTLFGDEERERINAFDWFGVTQGPLSGPAALPGGAALSRGQGYETSGPPSGPAALPGRAALARGQEHVAQGPPSGPAALPDRAALARGQEHVAQGPPSGPAVLPGGAALARGQEHVTQGPPSGPAALPGGAALARGQEHVAQGPPSGPAALPGGAALSRGQGYETSGPPSGPAALPGRAALSRRQKPVTQGPPSGPAALPGRASFVPPQEEPPHLRAAPKRGALEKPQGWKASLALLPPTIPDIMRAGGFDCVIGNPPYVRIQHMKEWAPVEVEYYKQKYKSASSGNYDIYVVFVEKGLTVLNKNGKLGFIVPHKFFNSKYGEPLRSLIADGKHLSHIVHFGDQQVFEGATNYTCLLFLDKSGSKEFDVAKVDDLEAWRNTAKAAQGTLPASSATAAEWNFAVGGGAEILQRLRRMPTKLADVAKKIFQGLVTSADPVYLLDPVGPGRKGLVIVRSRATGREYELESDVVKPLCKGSRDIRRYSATPSKAVLFPYDPEKSGQTKSIVLISPSQFDSRYPRAWRYLAENRNLLRDREKGKMRHEGWYGYVYPKSVSLFSKRKIITPSIASSACFTLDARGELYFVGSGGGGGGGYGIILNDTCAESYEYVLGLLNSRLLDHYLKQISGRFRGGYFAYSRQFIEQLPIRPINFSDPADKARHDRMVELVERMLELNKRKHAVAAVSDRRSRPSEAGATGVAQRSTLQPGEHSSPLQLEREIAATDAEIDNLVYELYGITDHERQIIEAM
jgi:type I restriction-modification system DNA methylase subunit